MYPLERRGGCSSLLPVQKNGKSGSIPKTCRSLSTPVISARDLVLTASCDTHSCSTSFSLSFSWRFCEDEQKEETKLCKQLLFPWRMPKQSPVTHCVWFLPSVMRTAAGTPAGNPAEEMAKSSGCHKLQQQCLLSLAGA